MRVLFDVAVCASITALSQGGCTAPRLSAAPPSAPPAGNGSAPTAGSARHAGTAGGVSLAGLSAEQLAGQRVIYSYSGLTPPASLLTKIRLGEAAGVIFFGGNISGLTQIRGVIKELQQANSHGPVRAPLLMLTDQEGGLVRPALRCAGAPGEADRPVLPGPSTRTRGRHRRRAEPEGRRHEREPGASNGRVQHP